MKVICITTRYWPSIGGSQMHCRKLLQGLQHSVNVKAVHFCANEHSDNELACAFSHSHKWLDDKVETVQAGPTGLLRILLVVMAHAQHHLRVFRPLFDLLMRRYAQQTLLNVCADADQLHLIYNGVTAIAESTAAVAAHYKIPLVITPLLSFGRERKTAYPGRRLLKLYRQAQTLIALTTYEKNYLMHLGISGQNIRVIPVGPLLAQQADGTRFRNLYQLNSAPIVLFLSRHVPGKGFNTLIEAIPQIWARLPNTHFVFLGPKDSTAMRCINQYKDARIIQIESSCQQLKSDALAACNLLCVPTMQEGLGGVFIEAWRYKKPVIGGDIPVLQEVFASGRRGLLTRAIPGELALAVETLLTQHELAEKLGQNGWLASEQLYQWPQIIRKTLAIYQQIRIKAN